MGLFNEKTHWIFLLSCANNEPEERHIQDIVFGVSCLQTKNIKKQNVTIIIDSNAEIKDSNWYVYLKSRYSINSIRDMNSLAENNSYDNLVLFVTGHGGIEGIPTNPSISPFILLEWLKHTKGLKRSVVYLGQCYAGIFNYMPVWQEKDELGEVISPEIVIIGATSLFSSISSSMTEEVHQGKDLVEMTWIANLFLYYIFYWLKEPFDVDGDGKYTVADSYKFSGAHTNNYLVSSKCKIFHELINISNRIREIDKTLNIEKDVGKLLIFKMLKNIKERDFLQKSDIHFTHQEPWILNSIPAQSIEF